MRTSHTRGAAAGKTLTLTLQAPSRQAPPLTLPSPPPQPPPRGLDPMVSRQKIVPSLSHSHINLEMCDKKPSNLLLPRKSDTIKWLHRPPEAQESAGARERVATHFTQVLRPALFLRKFRIDGSPLYSRSRSVETLSSEYDTGTWKTVTARSWPWLSGPKSCKPFKLFPFRSEAVLRF